MKIIFLDIDGVLNCKGTHNPRKFPYVIDPILLGRLMTWSKRPNPILFFRRPGDSILLASLRPVIGGSAFSTFARTCREALGATKC
jgi:hypothetical protein